MYIDTSMQYNYVLCYYQKISKRMPSGDDRRSSRELPNGDDRKSARELPSGDDRRSSRELNSATTCYKIQKLWTETMDKRHYGKMPID